MNILTKKLLVMGAVSLSLQSAAYASAYQCTLNKQVKPTQQCDLSTFGAIHPANKKGVELCIQNKNIHGTNWMEGYVYAPSRKLDQSVVIEKCKFQILPRASSDYFDCGDYRTYYRQFITRDLEDAILFETTELSWREIHGGTGSTVCTQDLNEIVNAKWYQEYDPIVTAEKDRPIDKF